MVLKFCSLESKGLKMQDVSGTRVEENRGTKNIGRRVQPRLQRIMRIFGQLFNGLFVYILSLALFVKNRLFYQFICCVGSACRI